MTLRSRLRLDAVGRARLRTVVLGWLAALGGLAILYHFGFLSIGGHLWRFEARVPAHRYTAMAMLSGSLKLRTGLQKVGLDEQVYNGAAWTNWGFGVPVLEMPFHLAAAKIRALKLPHFFPDRAIFFSYFVLGTPVIWAGFDRLMAMRGLGSSKFRRLSVSWAATAFVLTFALYPHMSAQFTVYFETIAYFVLAELIALGAFILALRDESRWAIAGLAIAAGFGLLIRPTGMLYLGMWVALVALELRSRRSWITFGAVLAPFLLFWAVSNWEKTGAILSFGFQNSLPGPENMRQQRFSSPCAQTPAHFAEVAIRLFNGLFGEVTHDPNTFPWLHKCNFHFEGRPLEGGGVSGGNAPDLGIGFFFALSWMMLHQLARRVWRLAVYLPAVLFVLIFGAYVWAGVGFSWRYQGDFWPLLIVAAVQYVRFLPQVANSLFGMPLALLLTASSGLSFLNNVQPFVNEYMLSDAEASHMYEDFQSYQTAHDPPLPTRLMCQDHPRWPEHNGTGWEPGCRVGIFTNLYIGVPQKSSHDYVLSFQTEGIDLPTVPLYLNGHIYAAHKTATGYEANVNIHYERLSSPIVMLTIEWTHSMDDPVGIKLNSVELH